MDQETPAKRFAVFSIRATKGKEGSTWIRVGSAWKNKDGSLNVYLDALPTDGILHIRDAQTGEESTIKL